MTSFLSLLIDKIADSNSTISPKNRSSQSGPLPTIATAVAMLHQS